MANRERSPVTRYLRRMVSQPCAGGLTDAQLLEQFVAQRDEAAFEVLVWRHGPKVLGVCRRVLRHEQDAEDAFQATFLVLVRKAGSIGKSQAVGSWLSRVAFRVALRAKVLCDKQGAREKHVPDVAASARQPEWLWSDLRPLLDDEVNRLPAKYRAPFLLCYVDGKTNEEAAQELGCPKGTILSRLAWARERLRERLTRRGVTLSAGLLAAALTTKAVEAGVPAALVDSTLKTARLVAAGKAVAEVASSQVAAFTNGALQIMLWTKIKLIAACVLAVGFLGGGVLALQTVGARPAAGQPASVAKAKAEPPPKPADKPEKTDDPPVDRLGDLLPEGALARLGTLRFGHGAPIACVAFSGDNKLLASGGMDGFVNVWDVSTGQRRLHVNDAKWAKMFGFGTAVGVALSSDGACLAIAWVNSPPELWEVRTGKKLLDIGDTFCRGSRVQFSGNGKYLTISPSDKDDKDGTAILAEVETGKVIFSSAGEILLLPERFIHLDPNRPEVSLRKLGDNEVSIQFKGHKGSVTAAALTPDGKKLFTHGSDRTLRVWDTTTGKELHRLDKTPETACQLVPAPDAKSILTLVNQASSMQCWDVESGQLRWTAKVVENGSSFAHASFLPEGNSVVTGHGSGRLRQWDIKTGKEQKIVRTTFDGDVSCMALSPDGKTLATTVNRNDINTSVYLWDAATLTPKAVQQGHTQQIVAAAFSPDGQIIATSGLDRTVRLWEPRAGILIRTIETPTNASPSLLFTPDGKTLVTGNGSSATGEVRFWDVETGKETRKFKAAPKGPIHLAMSPDGQRVFTSGSDNRFRCWDANTFQQLGEFGDEKPSYVLRLALSPDGSTLATVQMDQILRIWDARTFKKLHQLTGAPRSHIGAIAFSPDNSLLAWSNDGIRLTDVASGNEVRRLSCRANSFDGIAFASDGKTLAWGVGQDLPANTPTVGVWEVRTSGLRRTLDGHDGPAVPLAFSPNGTLLVTAGSDSSALIWDMRRRHNTKQALVAPSPEKLGQCWDLLANNGAAKAFDSMETFRQFPEQGVAWIAEHLKPIPRAPSEKVAALLRDLDSDTFETRDAATRELERFDEAVTADLQRLARTSESVEARKRAERLLARIDNGRLQRERAIEILEMIGSAAAVKLLESLADGQPDAPLTRDARGALHRLNPSGK
jgi:RNA polymerase sigma factor (sigma-70 family)